MIKVDIKPTNVIKTRLGLQKNGKAHAFFTATCAKAMDKYVPFDKGTLAGTVIKDGKPTENVMTASITYTQIYARYVYYGLSRSGNELHYQTDKHRLAGPYWDKRMWSAEKDKIERQVENYIKTRGGN